MSGISATTSLAELGMDSMTCVEISQTLERQFDLFLSVSKIRTLSIIELQAMGKENLDEDKELKVDKSKAALETDENLVRLKIFTRLFGSYADLSNHECTKLRTKVEENRSEIFFIPGMESVASVFDQLVSKIEAPVTGLQLGICKSALDSIYSMADSFLPVRKSLLFEKKSGHSLCIGY